MCDWLLLSLSNVPTVCKWILESGPIPSLAKVMATTLYTNWADFAGKVNRYEREFRLFSLTIVDQAVTP